MSKARDIADLGAVTSRLDTVGASDGALSNRNLIINGAMQVAQRGTSETGITGSGYHSLDRFKWETNTEGAATIEQSTDAASGFGKSYKVTITTAETTIDNGEYESIVQYIEGNSLQSLRYGTSAAQSITCSFWVKCSETGIATVALYQDDANQYKSQPYTINSANTWEYKTVTFAGNTVSAINNDNTIGLRLQFNVAAGSNYTGGSSDVWGTSANFAVGQTIDLVETTNATVQITGVQLEVGDTATPFEHRSFGDELARCQRYYQECIIRDRVFSSYNNSSASYGGSFQWRTIMRAAPTASGGTNASAYASNNSNVVSGRLVLVQATFADGCEAYLNYDTAGAHSWFVRSDSLRLDAEL